MTPYERLEDGIEEYLTELTTELEYLESKMDKGIPLRCEWSEVN